ncbi:MAG: RagB/SusD family nutrient uptake outer membrane protein [Muribaculum sp.]|nr:RagB/SusD family nutrient uptake outer membrane protein [Muribaculaceae bacterium]MCM1080297.1 RagB/SusD family nutrient uptake outer membrane protein [Muribaculum sp.]
MKKLLYTAFAATALLATTGCIEEVDPMTNIVTSNQVNKAPGSFDALTDALTSPLVGQFNYWPAQMFPMDYGYPSMFLIRDVMGQDMVCNNSGSYYGAWAFCTTSIYPKYALCQFPWTDYFQWIKNCNIVIGFAGSEPDEDRYTGVGIAYALRAMFYTDLAMMYSQQTYLNDPQSLTVPWVDEHSTTADSYHNPRVTNEVMFNHIISDLDNAEKYLANYVRPDGKTPDLSVVYGLKARAYLYMGEWALAQKYAKEAQKGYVMMSQAEYCDRNTGFNTHNSSWMLYVGFKSDDPCIQENDADSSWGSTMSYEIFHNGGKGCGYASNYGYQIAVIDRHLYETIPASDFRKGLFVDFAVNDLDPEADDYEQQLIKFLSAYSDYPDELATTPVSPEYAYGVAGFSTKFRVAGGLAGHNNQYIGFLQEIPLMRVEEMKLIEAEAAGMLNESEGIRLLTEFALTRDPNYKYGTHNEAYYNPKNTQFQNEIWWQRRVELWGEGFGMYDMKRFQKGLIRSYENTNHIDMYQWNVETTPQWMTFLFGGTEPTYNYDLIQNPLPTPPSNNSPKHVW